MAFLRSMIEFIQIHYQWVPFPCPLLLIFSTIHHLCSLPIRLFHNPWHQTVLHFTWIGITEILFILICNFKPYFSPPIEIIIFPSIHPTYFYPADWQSTMHHLASYPRQNKSYQQAVLPPQTAHIAICSIIQETTSQQAMGPLTPHRGHADPPVHPSTHQPCLRLLPAGINTKRIALVCLQCHLHESLTLYDVLW